MRKMPICAGYLIDQIRLQKPGRKQVPIDDNDRKIVLDAY